MSRQHQILPVDEQLPCDKQQAEYLSWLEFAVVVCILVVMIFVAAFLITWIILGYCCGESYQRLKDVLGMLNGKVRIFLENVKKVGDIEVSPEKPVSEPKAQEAKPR